MKKLFIISLIFLITFLSLSGCGYTEADLEESYDAGSHAGYEAGYDIGYAQGLIDGKAEGYDIGFEAGLASTPQDINIAYRDGYNAGYAQGEADALGEIPIQRYIGSINSDVYHYPWCICAQQILPENEVWFDSAEEAQAAGYRPCEVCNPPE